MKCLILVSTLCCLNRLFIHGENLKCNSGESADDRENDKMIESKASEDEEGGVSDENDSGAQTEEDFDMKFHINPEPGENKNIQHMDSSSEVKKNKISEETMKRFIVEMAAGDPSDLIGQNPHIQQAHIYNDLGRRFVPQYKYTESSTNVPEEPEDNELIPERAPPELVLLVAKESALLGPDNQMDLGNATERKKILRSGNYWNGVWKEEVNIKNTLRASTQTKVLSSTNVPEEPEDNELIPEKAPPELVLLVAKESSLLGPDNQMDLGNATERKKILRSGNYWNGVWKEEVNVKNTLRTSTQTKVLGSIKAKIKPGSEFFKVVSRMKKISPRLLYIINKKQP